MDATFKTALITGTSRGIGAVLERRFLAKGWQVISCGRFESPSRTAEDLSQSSCIRLNMDVTDIESIEKVKETLTSKNLQIDVLINNAGVFPEPTDTPFRNLSLEWFEQAMDVNFLGTIRVIQSVLPLMQGTENPRIVNMSSGAASITQRSGRRYCYGASKAALNHLTRGLAEELKPQGVTVVSLSPGWVKTDMGGAEADLEPEPVATSIVDTILSLKIQQSGYFLDRFGKTETYAW